MSAMTATTDGEAVELTWRMTMVTSLLLGFVAHSTVSSLTLDIRSLIKHANIVEWPVFFVARFFGIGFLISSLILLESHIPGAGTACSTNTRFSIFALFLSLALHHLFFALRAISIYTNSRSGVWWTVFTLQMITVAGIVGTAILTAIQTQIGITFPTAGCVFLLRSDTLPPKVVVIVLASLSAGHQLITTLLVFPRMYANETLQDQRDKDGVLRHLHDLTFNGSLFWIIRTTSLTIFFILPIIFLTSNQVLLMSALTIHTAMDVEMGAQIMRKCVPPPPLETQRQNDHKSWLAGWDAEYDKRAAVDVRTPRRKSSVLRGLQVSVGSQFNLGFVRHASRYDQHRPRAVGVSDPNGQAPSTWGGQHREPDIHELSTEFPSVDSIDSRPTRPEVHSVPALRHAFLQPPPASSDLPRSLNGLLSTPSGSHSYNTVTPATTLAHKHRPAHQRTESEDWI